MPRWGVRFVVPSVDLRAHPPAPGAARHLTHALCRAHGVVALRSDGRNLVVASRSPSPTARVIAELEAVARMPIQIVHASADEIDAAITASYGAPSSS